MGRIVADSFDELDRIEALVAGGLPGAAVLVRVTPGVEAHTHEYIATGADDSKFGFTVVDRRGARRRAARRQVRRAAASPGSTATSGRRSSALESFALAVARWSPISRADVAPTRPARRSARSTWAAVSACRYTADDLDAPPIAEFAASSATRSRGACRDAGLDPAPAPHRRGRAARSPVPPAITLYTVGTIKEIPGVRTYVAVDGGMSDNPRPATYGAGYEAFVPGPRRPRPGRSVATVAGKHCEQGDLLVARRPPARRPRGRRRAGHAGHRRLRVLDGVELQPGAALGGRVRPRRRRAGSSSAGRSLDDLVARDA